MYGKCDSNVVNVGVGYWHNSEWVGWERVLIFLTWLWGWLGEGRTDGLVGGSVVVDPLLRFNW